jgi:hypothetical protein
VADAGHAMSSPIRRPRSTAGGSEAAHIWHRYCIHSSSPNSQDSCVIARQKDRGEGHVERLGECRRATRRTRGCPGKRLNGATSPAFDDFVRLPCLARFSRPTFLARRGEGRTRPGPSPLLEVVTGASWARPQRSDGVVEQDSRKSSLRPAADHGWARVPIPPAPSTRTISQSRPSPSSEADLSADLARISETPPCGSSRGPTSSLRRRVRSELARLTWAGAPCGPARPRPAGP